MNTSLPARYNQNAKSSHSRRQFQIAPLFVFLSNALPELEESPGDCLKIFFNTTTFHRFLFSPQINGQSDFHSILNTLLIHLFN